MVAESTQFTDAPIIDADEHIPDVDGTLPTT